VVFVESAARSAGVACSWQEPLKDRITGGPSREVNIAMDAQTQSTTCPIVATIVNQ